MKLSHSGKVRDVYEVAEDKFVIVATDRVSAFDRILPKPVEGKGKVLNALSLFWFNKTKNMVNNHVISGEKRFIPMEFHKPEFAGRALLVKKLNMIPFEFVVRGHIYGKMWESYQETGDFCGENIKKGMELAGKLEKPILTVSTKSNDPDEHDEYVSFWKVAEKIDVTLFHRIKDTCIELYNSASEYFYQRGLILADSKFEFGLDENDRFVLADEIFTPDSSRIWSLEDFKPGQTQKSYDKQILRDWLENNKKDGEKQFDAVPDEIYSQMSSIYTECQRKIIG